MSKKHFTRALVFFGFPVTLVCGVIAQSEVNLAPCGVVVQVGKAAQIIPAHGKVVNHVSNQAAVECNAMVLTHQDPMWIKLSNQALIKLAPHTFLELPNSKGIHYRVYRGEVLITAPPSGMATMWTTPNAEMEIKGGVAWLQYLTEDRRSTVGVFNRAVVFRNKFNSDAIQKVSTGEMSTLAIRDARVMPSQPAVMSHSRLSEVLAHFSISLNEKNELIAIVKEVYEDRAKALTSDIEEWQSEPAEPLARGIASVPEHRKAVDPKEESFVIKMMKERLYGGGEEPAQRAPASKSKAVTIQDSEFKKIQKKREAETRRVEKQIERLDPDLVD